MQQQEQHQPGCFNGMAGAGGASAPASAHAGASSLKEQQREEVARWFAHVALALAQAEMSARIADGAALGGAPVGDAQSLGQQGPGGAAEAEAVLRQAMGVLAVVGGNDTAGLQVREREREGGREGGREGERERGRVEEIGSFVAVVLTCRC